MTRSIFVLAVASAASVAAAQPRSAIETARQTAATAQARNAAVSAEQAAAQQQVASASGKTDSAAAPAATKSAAAPARRVPDMTREVFVYDGGGRRDPFISLSRNGELSPALSEMELRITVVPADPSKALATIRDKTTQEFYQVRVGDSLGRYRVVAIDKRSITFAIDEFGFSRQEKLALFVESTTKVRKQ
jgi:hypothetical protein